MSISLHHYLAKGDLYNDKVDLDLSVYGNCLHDDMKSAYEQDMDWDIMITPPKPTREQAEKDRDIVFNIITSTLCTPHLGTILVTSIEAV